MNKIAIVTDSNSGITQKQGKELGIHVLPMPFIINDEIFYEDINLSQKDFYNKLAENVDVSTSQPSVDSILTLWNELLETYDSIIHIPMSSGLSSSCSTATMLANDFDNKVFVVDNQRISVTQRQSVLDAIELMKADKTAKEIKDYLEEVKYESSIYIMLDTLKLLKKGGRITPAVAAIGTILKLKPVLTIQGDRLDAFSKARTSKQGVSIMLDAIQKDIDTRFGGIGENLDNVHLFVAHTQNDDGASSLREELLKIYPGINILINPLSLSVSCHIGPGALAVACSKKIAK